MSLAAGAQLGPYEIVSPLGAGGMGEVYRARDPRIGREVAIKVLPAAFARDPDRLRRFEQEVRAAGALNHPNILTIFDVGAHDGSPYIVSELLEGETLRERISGAAPGQRKALDYAQQTARGLAAAHAKGIVHRDLKPENLFVTRDGRLKILDFGLAKLTHREPSSADETATEEGVVLGTLGYMSPEQVRGKPADHRSDLFSFGAILYEMLEGQRAFRGESAADVMSAILKEEPRELAASPALDRIVRRCLEKNQEERFQSASDLAFALEALSSPSEVRPAAAALEPPARRRRRIPLWLVAAAVLAGALAIGVVGGRQTARTAAPVFHRLTFRRGTVWSARFAPDGQTIVYTAAWDGAPPQIFSTRLDSTESRALGIPESLLLSISSSGEMALSLKPRMVDFIQHSGTLARAPLAGGAPRSILDEVHTADWAPGGAALAVVRVTGGRMRLEFPPGKTLYETAGWIGQPRLSPQGDRIAFLDHPLKGDDAGSVAIVDAAGNKKTLTATWMSAVGLAWFGPGRDEIWFTAATAGGARALYSVTLSGGQRLVYRAPSTLTLQDVSRDGRVLLTQENFRAGMVALPPGQTEERELSWLDSSLVTDLSPDGKTLLFTEAGDGGGATYAVYTRPADGSPAVRLGDGLGTSLSPDGRWVFSIVHPARHQIVLLPMGAGEARRLEPSGMTYHWGGWFPDGQRIHFAANEPGRGLRVWVQDLAGGKPRSITPEGVARLGRVSPDSKWYAGGDPQGRLTLFPVEEGEPRPVPGVEPGFFPIRWSSDGRLLYGGYQEELPARIYRVDIATGRKEVARQLLPSDPAGIISFGSAAISADDKAYAYTYIRILSDLSLVEGLK